MDDNSVTPPIAASDRRRFLATSGKAALAAPAVALLLAAGAKPAHALDGSPGPGQYFTDSTLPR